MQLDELKARLRKQLEYYFSPENLAHDEYLRTQMDQDQFVNISIIASFNQIRKLTSDVNMVTQVLRGRQSQQQVLITERPVSRSYIPKFFCLFYRLLKLQYSRIA